MFICSKKKYGFKNGDGERFTTAGGMTFETAPDWIANDPYFAAIVAEGDIIECKNNSAAEEAKVIAKATAKNKPAPAKK